MYYNLLVHVPSNTAIIRPACNGLTDIEFEKGVRVKLQTTSVYILQNSAIDDNFRLLDDVQFPGIGDPEYV